MGNTTAVASSVSIPPGRIPYYLRIGVTGHRDLTDDHALVAQIRDVLEQIRGTIAASPHTPVYFTVVSALAEGADRLVACVVLDEPEATLDAVLPMSVEQYAVDFTTADSRSAFNALLDRATTVTIIPPSPTRDDAYARAGEWMLQNCDAVIAIWDGQDVRGTGGTAEIAERARAYGIPRYWIRSEAPHVLTVTSGKGIDEFEYQQLDRYNVIPVDENRLAHEIDATRRMLDKEFHRAGLDKVARRVSYQGIVPPFVRADLVALRFQTRFAALDVLPLFLAALAIAIVATQSQFFPGVRLAELGEILCLLAIVVIFLVARQWRLHERWITNRFLAERLRSALFLSMLRTPDHADAPLLGMERDSERWMRRALGGVWNQCPSDPLPADAAVVGGLRQFLVTAWIEPQIDYNERTGRRSRQRHQLIGRVAIAFFVLAVLAKVIHFFGAGFSEMRERYLGPLLITLALVFPALFTAVEGINVRGDYERKAEESTEIAALLKEMKRRMETAPDLDTLRAEATHVEQIMQGENACWLASMRFYDAKLHI